MNASAEAQIRNRKVICSRCGSEMQPEQFWHRDHAEIPFLFWRCETGHITQALPIPYDVLEHALRGAQPLLR